MDLVSHYSAISDTISCDTPYSAIGFRGELFLRYCLWIAIGHFYGRKGGCSSDSLRYHRKHSATGVLLHLSRDRGEYFGRVTKIRVRQRSGEGVVRRNGCPKGCFWRVRFFSAPLRFVLKNTCEILKP